MDFAGIFSEVWTYIVGIISGIGGGAFVSWIFSLIVSHSNRKHTKALLEAIEAFKSSQIVELATNKGIDRLKEVNLTTNIQPIVASEIKKAYEVAFESLKEELKLTQKRYSDLVKCFEALSEYFEYSYGVSDETRQELKNAIDVAKNDVVAGDDVKVEVVVVDKAEEPVAEQKNVSKTTKVSR